MAMFGKKEKSQSSSTQADPVAEIELTPSQVVAPEPPPPAPRPKSAYNVEDAIQLMRKLPTDPASMPLVVQVVRSTLASLNVRVEDIIEDATRRQEKIEDGIIKLKGQITDLEKEIATRKQEISRLETDLSETTAVKERLLIGEAQSHGGNAASKAAPAPAPAASMDKSDMTPAAGTPAVPQRQRPATSPQPVPSLQPTAAKKAS
jgi:TolA-binding protein